MTDDIDDGLLLGGRSVRKRVSGRLTRPYSARADLKEDDLVHARAKLDSLLESISRGEETYDDDYFDDDHNGFSSPVKSKRPRGPRKIRKRTREDEYLKSSMFLLKLFDRTVDLSEFCSKYSDSDPPLYPVCRAWIRNNEPFIEPISTVDENQTAVNELEVLGYTPGDKTDGLYILPPPEPKPVDTEGHEVDVKIPNNSKTKKEPIPSVINESINSMVDKSRESLLESNISHWRTVHKEWREAAAQNHARYKSSFEILQTLSTVPTMTSHTIDEEMLAAM